MMERTGEGYRLPFAAPEVIDAILSGIHEIEIWGDGQQTRSFMYIDDCLYGTQMLLDSDFVEPINIGSAGDGQHKPIWLT